MNIGILSGLGSAILFGASTPLAKVLVGIIDPWLLAGPLYLGSGLGLSAYRFIAPCDSAPLSKPEWLWLGGAILSGGVMGPVLLMIGLTTTPSGTASLLLNAEGVLTALLAWFVFKENFDRRIALGMVAIIGGAIILSWNDKADITGFLGPLCIIGACLCWAVDNNLTRKVSLSDPVQIASLKGLVAGSVNTVLALGFTHAQWPDVASIGAAALLGLFGYGISLVLFVIGLRHLGTARAGAYFSAAPFVGALIAILFLGEAVTERFVFAAILMAIGVCIHLIEDHEHDHKHDDIEHDHSHSHDDSHHAHAHETPVKGEHSHSHRHQPIRHSHPHYPDSHHRHTH